MERSKELDGIRGLAILLVMLFHVGSRVRQLTGSQALISFFSLFNSGWIGVDLFFVLSGFLITSILLRTKDFPNYYRNFYARRILRVFPLYYIVIVPMLFFLPLIDQINGLEARQYWPLYLLYQQNWLFLFNLPFSYFIGVTWSLAIEEQFYFIWPTVAKLLDAKRLAIVGIGTMAAALAARIILVLFWTGNLDIRETIYYITPTRLDGLMVGGLLAIAFKSEEGKQNLAKFGWPILLVSVMAYFAIVALYGDSPFSNNLIATLGYSLLALAGGGLIILSATLPEGHWFRKSFRNRGLVFFGKYSYALYLIHVPLVLAISNWFIESGRRSGMVALEFLVFSMGGSILFALLSWNLLEKRALSLKRYFD